MSNVSHKSPAKSEDPNYAMELCTVVEKYMIRKKNDHTVRVEQYTTTYLTTADFLAGIYIFKNNKDIFDTLADGKKVSIQRRFTTRKTPLVSRAFTTIARVLKELMQEGTPLEWEVDMN